MKTKRDMARQAIMAYRHAEKYHMGSRSYDVWADGYDMQSLANMVTEMLYGRKIKPKAETTAHVV